MKVFVAGGSGRVAAAVIAKLVEGGHEVWAGSRHVDAIPQTKGVHPVELDLHASVDKLAEKVRGMDAVYFLAGSRGKDLLQTDAFGAVKLMQASEKVGVKRFVQLSAIFAMKPEKWAGEPSLASIVDYDIAKFFADEWLVSRTNLDFTIVAPSVLEEKPATGKVEFSPEHAGTNPIPDVASVLVGILDRPNTYGKVIEMTGGDTPIDEALQSL